MAWFEDGSSRVYYEEEGAGEPVLLVPGITQSADDLKPIRQALTPRYRVIAADPPGSGRSSPQPRQYTSTYYHDDARTFLALLKELNATPAHVVGFSDGGEYALLMAELDPASVASLVTWGAAGRLAAPAEFIEAFGDVVDNPASGLEGFATYLKSTYGEDNARAMLHSAAEAWAAIIASGGDISRSRAGEIACRALLITGENDAMFAPPDVVSDLAGAMPNAEFVLAEGAGHSIHHEKPDWLATTIVGWLAKA
jgi:valacyclovir hydrolase